MSHFLNTKNVNKTVSSFFPRINKSHYLETSIEHTYNDVYFPINSWQSDRFIEFRLPKTVGTFIDLANLHLQYQLQVYKKIASGGVWSGNTKTGSGDHYDLIQFTGQSCFKHLQIELNGVQITNEANYSLNSYIKLITQFPEQEINKIGKLYHVEKYDKIVKTHSDDSYFSSLSNDNDVAKRLKNIRDHGIFLRSPLMSDICQIPSYLIDGIDVTVRLSLHENSFIFITAQQNPDVSHSDGKKYLINLSDIKLSVKKIKPSENAYTALQKTLEPKGGIIPTLDYIYTSKVSRQFHIPSGVNEHIIDLPYNNNIPEKIFIAFQAYDNFNTRDWKENGLYLEHLNLSNVFITINGSTMYNIKCDFETGDVAELYNTCLLCLDKNHLLTFNHFKNGMTILGFPLTTYDPSADIRSPYYGILRISLTFKSRMADSAICYMLGDIMSILSVNYNREIVLNKI